jgi:hypothetical protein
MVRTVSITMDYTKMTRTELISLCKEKGIRGYSGKKLAEIISLLSAKESISTPVIQEQSYVMPPKEERIKRLKEHLCLSTVNHEEQLMKSSSLKEAHVYCVINGLSAQQYGPLLEKYIRNKFNYVKNKAEDCNGDCSKGGENSEVKASLGGVNHTKFNFVQLRPSHDCNAYIFTAYHLSSENVDDEGELFVFKIPKADSKVIIARYGGYAHGTIKEHGRITLESLNDANNIKEYALRPTIHDACWKTLLAYRILETEL